QWRLDPCRLRRCKVINMRFKGQRWAPSHTGTPMTMTTITCSLYFYGGRSGPRPHELYGTFTWMVNNFSQLKTETRSDPVDIGGCKWYSH
ncbi:hypothetical protein EJB05_28516, partial [Eragrostis curvula]